MDRVHDTRACEERAEDGELERESDEHHVPDLQHALAFLDHHRVKERGCGEPRHQRCVLDRVPCVVAAPSDLDVRPVGAEELSEAEKRPRSQRPAARCDDPALVGAAGEHRARGEGERDREADVAEVEHRRVRHHVGVLQARRQPRSVDRGGLCAERARDCDEHEREERRDATEHGHDPCDQVAQQASVHSDGQRAVSGEHQEPQEQRALLPTPECAQRVDGRQGAVRVRRDVREREVVTHECACEHDGRDQSRCEARDERVAR